MSTRTNGRFTPHLDSATGYSCRWQMCTSMVTQRFWRRGMHLCQEHALLAWSTVQAMMDEGRYLPKPEKPKLSIDGREGSVYYIRIGDRVKIGHTMNLFKRLATYPPTMEILAIRDGSRELEHQEHIRFGEHRTDGREWFEANEQVLQMISKVAEGTDRDWEQGWFQRRTHQPASVDYRQQSA